MTNQDKWTFKYQISAPTQDPFLMIDFLNDGETILFDCGVRVWGQVRTILKIKHLFISHAHIDHIIGFDHIIRALLGENKRLHIYGPQRIRDRLTAKLNGYDWDRAADQELVLEITELNGNQRITQTHECRKRFEMTGEPVTDAWRDTILQTQNYRVSGVQTDHGGSPCMAYVLDERDYLRVDKDKLLARGFQPGVWVGECLRLIERKVTGDHQVNTGSGALTLEEFQKEFLWVQRGRKVVYITDTVYSEQLVDDLRPLASGADLVVCESTFLDHDRDLARKYHHMTAVQAATIARDLGAVKLKLFHLSNRYFPKLNLFVKEARTIFPDTELSSGNEHRRRQSVRKRFARR